ncbi:MAG: ABC transporter ATP-binding protein [Methanomicrobiaceae archaeon]|nr:ABC transporter ATP-binding protein [Methanomicrobiaceae archaeon]
MDSEDIRTFRAYTAPYLRGLALVTGLAIVTAFFEAVNIGALIPLLQLMEGSGEQTGPFWDGLATALAMIGLELTFVSLAAALCVLFLIGQAIHYAGRALQLRIRVDFVAGLKTQMFREIFQSDIGYRYAHRSGNFINAMTTEVDNAGLGVFAATEMMTDLLFIAIYGIVLLAISVELTLFCAAVGMLGLYLMNACMKRSRRLGMELVRRNTEQVEFVTERFGLLRLIKTFSTELAEHRRFSALAAGYRDTHTRYGMHGIAVETVFRGVFFFTAILILYVSLVFLHLSLPLLMIFLFVMVRITAPLRNLGIKRHELARQLASFRKIDWILHDARAARTVQSGERIFPGFHSRIEITGVTYSYDKQTAVLRDVTLSIRKNEMLALVGASGGGKSTLVDLIVRLYDPDSGEILVDGVDLKEYDLASYHRRIGVVSQDILIFNDSVLANICYGSDHVSPAEAREAAVRANAHEFIAALPEGYATLLGDRGVRLSGGQKQRIALARALYRNPDILILDEATSSLDAESERIIKQSIRDIRHRYSIVAVAHRLSTVESADRIIVIENGMVVETGTHAELVRRGGYYTRYHALQHAGAAPVQQAS